MFAVGVTRGQKGIRSFDLPEPVINDPDEVLIKVREVGIDGTDYNIIKYGADFDYDSDRLILGHEMSGVVEEVGAGVTGFKPGDLVSMAIRHGCGICHPCKENQSDMCMTGLYTERGIHRLDGLMTEKVVEKEQYIVKVSAEFAEIAVLAEPISIVEKGIQQIRHIQSRMPWSCAHPEHSFTSPMWGGCKIALVIGAGSLGLLATALLRLAGNTVITIDIVPPTHPKARLVSYLEAEYLDVRGLGAKELMANPIFQAERLDVIFEASGASPIAGELISYMSRSSIYVMTGIPREDMVLNIDAAKIFRQMVRFNQVLVGSVNSSRKHFEAAVEAMPAIVGKYPELCKSIITDRYPLRDFAKAFGEKRPEHIKTIVEVSG